MCRPTILLLLCLLGLEIVVQEALRSKYGIGLAIVILHRNILYWSYSFMLLAEDMKGNSQCFHLCGQETLGMASLQGCSIALLCLLKIQPSPEDYNDEYWCL